MSNAILICVWLLFLFKGSQSTKETNISQFSIGEHKNGKPHFTDKASYRVRGWDFPGTHSGFSHGHVHDEGSRRWQGGSVCHLIRFFLPLFWEPHCYHSSWKSIRVHFFVQGFVFLFVDHSTHFLFFIPLDFFPSSWLLTFENRGWEKVNCRYKIELLFLMVKHRR